MMPGLPKIWFLRHGETRWNAERRIQGQLESALTAQGLADAGRQAALMRPILKNDPACFVSPLGRALRTAEIALAGRSFITDARLAEVHAGLWQGMLQAEVFRDFPDLAQPDMATLDVFAAAPDGEGFDAFQGRIAAFLSTLTEPSVIVAHGLLGQVLRGLVLGLDRTGMGRLTNRQGCVYVLENGTEQVLQ